MAAVGLSMCDCAGVQMYIAHFKENFTVRCLTPQKCMPRTKLVRIALHIKRSQHCALFNHLFSMCITLKLAIGHLSCIFTIQILVWITPRGPNYVRQALTVWAKNTNKSLFRWYCFFASRMPQRTEQWLFYTRWNLNRSHRPEKKQFHHT